MFHVSVQVTIQISFVQARLSCDTKEQSALKLGSVGALLAGNLISHRKCEVKLGNNARNFLSPQSVVTFLLKF